MTWFELKQFINKMNSEILSSEVKLYDFATGDEYNAGFTELLIAECKDEDECDGWVPYISINEEETEDGKVKETSIS